MHLRGVEGLAEAVHDEVDAAYAPIIVQRFPEQRLRRFALQGFPQHDGRLGLGDVLESAITPGLEMLLPDEERLEVLRVHLRRHRNGASTPAYAFLRSLCRCPSVWTRIRIVTMPPVLLPAPAATFPVRPCARCVARVWQPVAPVWVAAILYDLILCSIVRNGVCSCGARRNSRRSVRRGCPWVSSAPRIITGRTWCSSTMPR